MSEGEERNRGGHGGQTGDPKERYFRNLEESSYTIFVENLLMSMSKSWLWQLISFEGSIVDIYIVRKKSNTSSTPFLLLSVLLKRRMLVVLLAIWMV